MPRVKRCTGCGRLIADTGRAKCAECEEAYRAQRSEERREGRDWKAEYGVRAERDDPKYSRFYKSKEWHQVSRQYAVDRGHLCEECGKVGTDVHHIVPIQEPEGWARRFDRSNLMLLCVPCHNRMHRRFGGRHA